MPYLRRYYDAGIRADLALWPSHVKKFVATACEAMEGTPYIRQENPRPVLVLDALGDQCHLFLDVPRGVSKDYVVEDESLDQVRDACQMRQLLRPPPALKKQLDLLREPLEVRWEDPVCLCRICPSSSLFTSAAGASVVDTPVVIGHEEASWVFPFDLQKVKVLDQPTKAEAEANPPKPMPNVSESDPK